MSPGAVGPGVVGSGADARIAELLALWLPSNHDPERPLMTLATVSADGWPNARTVLLSSYDAEGFCFHTDAHSTKIAEADATGRAALMLHLPAQARQLVVQGTVEPTDADEQAWAYRRRPEYLRTLAWLNTDAFAALPDAERVRAWADFGARNPDPEPPSTWTGRRVRPLRLLFWSGSTETASRRQCFTRVGDTWREELRAG